MQIRILATGQSPDYYSIMGETMTAHLGGVTEVYDLSAFPEGGVFQSSDKINDVTAIRHVERVNGELRVTLCQQVGPGHWSESGWMDSMEYDPDAVHAQLDPNKPFAGRAWAKTRQGKQYMDQSEEAA